MFETIFQIVLFAGVLLVKLQTAKMFIPKASIDIKLAAIPAAVIIAEIVSLVINQRMVANLTHEEKHMN